MFGSDRIISPMIMSYCFGFLLFATVVEIGFMHWFQTLVGAIPIFSNLQLNFLVAVATVLLGILLSYVKQFHFVLQVVLLVVLPVGVLSVSHAAGIFQFKGGLELSVSEGFSALAELVDSQYLEDSNIKDYFEDVVEDDALSDDEKEKLIRDLQQRIEKLETENQLFEDIRKENARFKQQIDELELALGDFKWCRGARGSADRVYSYAEAVLSDAPCVRDFAVHLASKMHGSYHREGRPDGIPGETGIQQVLSIHTYLASAWKYVNDPTIAWQDYNSPADRTIALGLAGDCDDFAVVVAACVEAIGGIARIVHGECAGGGHAWAEVLVGGDHEWSSAVVVVRDFFGDRSRSVAGLKDSAGNSWLSLDWRLGEYSCSDRNIAVAFQR